MNLWVPVKITVGFDGGEYLATAKVQDYDDKSDCSWIFVSEGVSFPTKEECDAYVMEHNKDMWDKMNSIKYEEGKFKCGDSLEVDNDAELRFKQLLKEGYVVDDFDLSILKRLTPANRNFHIKRIKAQYRKG